jgi:3-dehydroquinate synthase
MKRIHIPLKKHVDNSYDINIFSGGFDAIAQDLQKKNLWKNCIVIADANTAKLFGEKFEKALKKVGLKSSILTVPTGEKSKKWTVAGKLLSGLAQLNVTRNDLIISLGGGVVGDLTAFVASVYKRGVAYVQIPTTLLSMVDGAISGKTGVDLSEGKNIAGTYWQPKKVYMSLEVLKSLPAKEIRSGLAEVIKYGCVWDRGFFNFMEKKMKKLLKRQRKISQNQDQKEINLDAITAEDFEPVISYIVQRSVEIKWDLVRRGEQKSDNLKSILNYGRTVGNAIELLGKSRLSHGEAIAIGMHYEALLAVKNGSLHEKELAKQDALFQLIGLPVELPKKMELGKILEVAKQSKRNSGPTIRCAGIRKIGKPVRGYITEVSDKVFVNILDSPVHKSI